MDILILLISYICIIALAIFLIKKVFDDYKQSEKEEKQRLNELQDQVKLTQEKLKNIQKQIRKINKNNISYYETVQNEKDE